MNVVTPIQQPEAAEAAPTKPPRPSTFRWDDALLLEDQLTEDERAIRDAAQAYCQDRLLPRVVEANRHGRFDRAILHEMGALGLLGATRSVPLADALVHLRAESRRSNERLADLARRIIEEHG